MHRYESICTHRHNRHPLTIASPLILVVAVFSLCSFAKATLGEQSDSCFLIARNLDKITTCVLFLSLTLTPCASYNVKIILYAWISECVLFNCRSSFAAHILSLVHFTASRLDFDSFLTSLIHCKACYFCTFFDVLRITEKKKKKGKRRRELRKAQQTREFQLTLAF